MSDEFLQNVCRSRLQKYANSGFGEAYRLSDTEELKKAAVLIPVFVKNGKLHVFLTLRSKSLPSYKGQVSFPGGKQENADEDIVATALREAQEEVGIPPEIVEVLIVWSPVYALQGEKRVLVYPVVGLLKSDFEVSINHGEVECVFDTPLDFFLSNEGHIYRLIKYKENRRFHMHFFAYNYPASDDQSQTQFLIWGLTAGLCFRLAVIVLERLPVGMQLKDPRETEGLQRYIEWLQRKPSKSSRL